MLVIQLDREFGVLVDEMGLPLPVSTVEALVRNCTEHLKKSAQERKDIALALVRRNCPNMEQQLDMDYFS